MAWWPDEATRRYGATAALSTTAAARSPRQARAACDHEAGQGRDREWRRERAREQLQVWAERSRGADQALVLVTRLLVESEVAQERLRPQDGVGGGGGKGDGGHDGHDDGLPARQRTGPGRAAPRRHPHHHEGGAGGEQEQRRRVHETGRVLRPQETDVLEVEASGQRTAGPGREQSAQGQERARRRGRRAWPAAARDLRSRRGAAERRSRSGTAGAAPPPCIWWPRSGRARPRAPSRRALPGDGRARRAR